jgi:hypothetical protein
MPRQAYSKLLVDLPKSGRSVRIPWSDTYWPSNKGGIAFRWKSNSLPRSFGYRLYSRSELFELSLDEMKALSPAEKYGVYVCMCCMQVYYHDILYHYIYIYALNSSS